MNNQKQRITQFRRTAFVVTGLLTLLPRVALAADGLKAATLSVDDSKLTITTTDGLTFDAPIETSENHDNKIPVRAELVEA